MDVIEFFNFSPIQRGGHARQGERQLMLSHTRRDGKSGYWRVVIGKAVAEEILDFAGFKFNLRFGRNKFTNEWFLVVEKGIPALQFSEKEFDRTQRMCFTSKPMYEALCRMLGIEAKNPKRIYYELSKNCSNTPEALTYKISLTF